MNNPIALFIRLYHYLNLKPEKTEEETILTVDIEMVLENFFDTDENFENHMLDWHAQDYEGLDDDMSDHYTEWRTSLTLAELIEEYEGFIS